MNFYRFFAYLLVLAAGVLAVGLAALLGSAGATTEGAAEIRKAILILLAVLLVLALAVVLLLCLGAAKDRKQARERGEGLDDAERRELEKGRALGLTRRLVRGREPRRGSCFTRLCDALVQRKLPRKCLEMPIDVTRLPDPCIYSQFFLMNAGQPVTWDNPDVKILLGGVEQYTYDLSASTTYDVEVSLKNASPFFDALGTKVTVNMLTFGAGAPTPAPLSQATLDVPARAGMVAAVPAVVHSLQWTTPATEGHYCIQVLIEHPDDVNPGNNEGWNNTLVNKVAAGRAFAQAIPVWNFLPVDRGAKGEAGAAAWRRFSQLEVDVDSYELPALDPVGAAVDVLFAERPALWGATVAPERAELRPGTHDPLELKFAVTVPPGTAAGTRGAFNVTVRAGGVPIGGVTLYVEVE